MKIFLSPLYLLFFFLAFSPLQAQPDLIFTFPQCLPDCNREDMTTSLSNSNTEQIFIDAIDKAQQSLTFAVYTFSRKPIFEALIRAASERGVRVRGIVDNAQLNSLKQYCNHQNQCQFGPPFDTPEYARLSVSEKLKKIENLPIYKDASIAAKLRLLFHQKEDLVNVQAPPGSQRLMHHKYLLVDDQRLLTGSGNWSYTAFSINYENIAIFDLLHNKEVVEAFVCNTELLWGGSGQKIHEQLPECQIKNQVYFTPSPSPDNGISARLLAAINGASKSIAISMHHLVYEPILQALVDAAKRKVKIKILFDDDDCLRKTPKEIKQMQKEGGDRVDVRYLPTNCALFQLSHNKYGVFDESLVINGSANWSKAGLLSNYENFIVFDDEANTKVFLKNFDELWAYAEPKPECGCNLDLAECREQFCIGRRRH